jgi:hypothetical protein
VTHHLCDYCGGFDLDHPDHDEGIESYTSLMVTDKDEENIRRVCAYCHLKVIQYRTLTPGKLDLLLGIPDEEGFN